LSGTDTDADAQVLIAGGGLAGLSCAAALADLGLKVIVLEQDDRAGGRASSWSDATTGDVVDIGPHVLTSEHRNMVALLGRLGTQDQVLWQKQPLITLLDAQRRIEMRSSTLPPPLHGLPNLPSALRCVGLTDLLSNRRVAWRAARMSERDSLSLDEVDALHYLKGLGVSQRFIDWFWTSACLALLNVPLHSCSATALMRVFRLLIGRSGYHFGFACCGLAELYVPGCTRSIERAGGRVQLSSRVDRLVLKKDRFEAFVLESGQVLRAGHAVLGVPPESLRRLLPAATPAGDGLARATDCFKGSPYVTSYLWFDRKITHERFWARVWSPSGLNTDFYDLSNIRSDLDPSVSVIACNAIHAHEAWTQADEIILRRTVDEIVEFAPVAAKARVRHARIHRTPMAIPCPSPGVESARPAAETGFPGLWLAGDWTRTGLPASMESATRSGALAAEAVAAALGRQLSVAEPVPETVGVMALLRRKD
jgi:squalene-associated FAD-dependent desaturase